MEYHLGENGQYKLTEKALNHIIKGDLSDRQLQDKNSKTILKKIITGGLHTWQAWCDFLNLRPDINHGVNNTTEKYENWYYARRLQNDVILLKIPIDCFNSKAANLTKFPQTYYKSGYLWKTLFPAYFDQNNIVTAIDEALRNIDIEETKKDLIIGYFNKKELFKSIKIRIQLQGNTIVSAFPTWSQPMTGNNGKPFSHIDAINTVISSSCIFLEEDYKKFYDATEQKHSKELLKYYFDELPDIIKTRKRYPKKQTEKERVVYNAERKVQLKRFGESLTDQEALHLKNICIKDEILRYPNQFMRYAFSKHYDLINKNLKYLNSVSSYQNLLELLTILSAYDKENKKFYAFDVISQLMKTRFIITGGLDQWEIKRLSNKIIDVIEDYSDRKITLSFLKLLSVSPIRVAFYIEFNLNTYFVTSPEFIGFTVLPQNPLTENHYYDYVAQNLGINYTTNFSNNFNISFVKDIQNEHLNGMKKIKYCVNFSDANEFSFFSTGLQRLFDTIDDQHLNNDEIKLLETIIFDYYRCVASNIQRSITKNKNILAQDLDFGDKDFIKYTKAKHEYQFLWTLNRMMIEDICEKLEKKGFTVESDNLEKNYLSIYSELRKIPMPKGVPEYLEN